MSQPQPEPDYLATLTAQLDYATQFRIPCPGHPYGRDADLRVHRRTDGRGDGWAVLNDNPGNEHAWTGDRWTYRCHLLRHHIYRYTREQAIAEAQRIAPLETARFLERMRAQAEQEQS